MIIHLDSTGAVYKSENSIVCEGMEEKVDDVISGRTLLNELAGDEQINKIEIEQGDLSTTFHVFSIEYKLKKKEKDSKIFWQASMSQNVV